MAAGGPHGLLSIDLYLVEISIWIVSTPIADHDNILSVDVCISTRLSKRIHHLSGREQRPATIIGHSRFGFLALLWPGLSTFQFHHGFI